MGQLSLTFDESLMSWKQFNRVNNTLLRHYSFFHIVDQSRSIIYSYGSQGLISMLEEPESFISDKDIIILNITEGSIVEILGGIVENALSIATDLIKIVITRKEYKEKLQIENEQLMQKSHENEIKLIELEHNLQKQVADAYVELLYKNYGDGLTSEEIRELVRLQGKVARDTLVAVDELRRARGRLKYESAEIIEINPSEVDTSDS